jgi:hypothetical protein
MSLKKGMSKVMLVAQKLKLEFLRPNDIKYSQLQISY